MSELVVIVSKGIVLAEVERTEANSKAKELAIQTGSAVTIRTLAAQKAAEFAKTPEGQAILAQKAAERNARITSKAEEDAAFKASKAAWLHTLTNLPKGKKARAQTAEMTARMAAKGAEAARKAAGEKGFVAKAVFMYEQGLTLDAASMAWLCAYGATKA